MYRKLDTDYQRERRLNRGGPHSYPPSPTPPLSPGLPRSCLPSLPASLGSTEGKRYKWNSVPFPRHHHQLSLPFRFSPVLALKSLSLLLPLSFTLIFILIIVIIPPCSCFPLHSPFAFLFLSLASLLPPLSYSFPAIPPFLSLPPSLPPLCCPPPPPTTFIRFPKGKSYKIHSIPTPRRSLLSPLGDLPTRACRGDGEPKRGKTSLTNLSRKYFKAEFTLQSRW